MISDTFPNLSTPVGWPHQWLKFSYLLYKHLVSQVSLYPPCIQIHICNHHFRHTLCLPPDSLMLGHILKTTEGTALTLIGLREGTVHPLSFLDQDVSADFLSKISPKKLEVKIDINRVILTLCQAH